MLDRYGRNIDYLRISLTDRCNLRCINCMPEDGICQVSHKEILTYDEIQRICSCITTVGIKKIKLTGGEPLTRKNCSTLVRMLKELPEIEKVTLTTNGMLLKEQIQELAEAGIDNINISLDTVDKAKFEKITRRKGLFKVLEGLEEALKYPNIGLKINCVPVVEEPENLVAVAKLAKEYPIHVRFIEMMPIGYGKEFLFRGESEICEILEKAYGRMTPISMRYGNGVRMTAEGYLKACLQYQTGISLKDLIRNGCTDEELTQAMKKVIWEKPVGHHFTSGNIEEDEMKLMSQIGG